MEAGDAARVAAQAADALVQAMNDPKNSYALPLLAQALATVAAHMDAKEAAGVAAQAAAALVEALKAATTNAQNRRDFRGPGPDSLYSLV